MGALLRGQLHLGETSSCTNRRVSVSNLCYSLALPTSILSRWYYRHISHGPVFVPPPLQGCQRDSNPLCLVFKKTHSGFHIISSLYNFLWTYNVFGSQTAVKWVAMLADSHYIYMHTNNSIAVNTQIEVIDKGHFMFCNNQTSPMTKFTCVVSWSWNYMWLPTCSQEILIY